MDFLNLGHADLIGLADDQLAGAVQEVARLANRVEALQVALAGEVHARSTGVPAEESFARRHGCRTSTEFLQRATLVSANTARSRIRLAEAVRPRMALTGQMLPARFEDVGWALEQGALPVESATTIVKMLGSCYGAKLDDIRAAEKHLVEAASGLDTGIEQRDPGEPILTTHADNIRAMCKVWHQALDPDGAAPNDEDLVRRRTLSLGREKYGLVPINGLLMPEVAASLARIFDSMGNPRARTPEPGAADKTGSEDTGPEDTGPEDTSKDSEQEADDRSPDQKRHDIFAAALGAAMRSAEMPSLGGAPVTVVIQAKEEDLVSGEGVGWLHDHEGTLTAVSLGSVRHAACGGVIQRVVQDKNGRITSLGTPERAFNAHQRRAIAVRDGGCVIPGCMIPPSWCEIHHVVPHARGGPTHTDNAAMLCYFHHRTLDSSGWEISVEDGVPTVSPPDWLLARSA